MDPWHQRILGDARHDGSNEQAPGFAFQPVTNLPRHPTDRFFHSGPSHYMSEQPMFSGSGRMPFDTPHHPLGVQSTFSGRSPFEASPYQPMPLQPIIPGRLTPRTTLSQNRTAQEPRVLSNADNHFRFTQNLRQGIPLNPMQSRSIPNYQPDKIEQLATAMLMNKPMYEREPRNNFQSVRPHVPNLLQPQKQQVTPPFNLSGFFHSPEAQQASTNSSPADLPSSPAARASMRRTTSRKTPGLRGYNSKIHSKSLALQFSPLRSPQLQTVQPTQGITQKLELAHAPPIAHGIQLISPHELSDRFRHVFPYELFNAAQSKCFIPIYKTNHNVVVSAPTGSGKTALLELAICKVVETSTPGSFKIVYTAPTKSLCSERMRDWNKKFSHLNLQCAELTGDTDNSEMTRVRNASIIVTTPEKWDSITRKWSDHHKLVQMVKLFLIDEVHIIKEERGATLEAIVSRMKTMGANVRFVALSATIPNSEDIAVWLGRDHCNQQLPALRETFGESFRPVKLEKHVYGFPANNMNDFMFEKTLDGKLPQLIRQHTQKKPIMVFCFTRKSCENTGTMLAEWWTRQKNADRAWPVPTQSIVVQSIELASLLTCGVAFHHAGLEVRDRLAVESSFLKGEISVICCTSTLAVGVNLPCHLVILKGTIGFQNNALTEYSDLEVMQMLGRAGRPQFEDSAIAVIMTKSNNQKKYEMMISGEDSLESSLHLNLIEHLNSEVSLGTINSIETAQAWIDGTFLAVRMRLNPSYYKIDGIQIGANTDQRLKLICQREIKLLQDYELLTGEKGIKCTEYGKAMSRYMVKFETMKLLLSLKEQSKMEQIFELICSASEFKDLRMKPNQRNCLREISKSPFLKFPIKENISTTAHKISLLIQSQLGAIEHPADKDFAIHRRQFQAEKSIVLDRVQRLIRCVVDCKAVDADAISTRHALDLARSLAAGFWENSNLQLRQIPQFGPVAFTKLVANKVSSIERLFEMDSGKIEHLVGKNPPFGKKTLDVLEGFPRLILVTELMGRAPSKPGGKPKVSVKAQLGFLNAKIPVWNSRKPSLTFTAETTEGVLVEFWRGNVHQLANGHEVKFVVELSNPQDEIICRVACDEIVGTFRTKVLKHNIKATEFPKPDPQTRLQEAIRRKTSPSKKSFPDEFGGDDIEDDDLIAATVNVEKTVEDDDAFIEIEGDPGAAALGLRKSQGSQALEPFQMANGKWTCSHACRNGTRLKNGQPCRHRCCREGLDRCPRMKTKASSFNSKDNKTRGTDTKKQNDRKEPSGFVSGVFEAVSKVSTKSNSKLKLKKQGFQDSLNEDIKVVDLTEELSPTSCSKLAARDYSEIDALHISIQEDKSIRLVTQKPIFEYGSGKKAQLPGINNENEEDIFDSSFLDEDFPSPSTLLGITKQNSNVNLPSMSTEFQEDEIVDEPFREPDSFEQDMIVSQNLPPTPALHSESIQSLETGLLELNDPVKLAPSCPKLSSGFANEVFDFNHFDDEFEADNRAIVPLDEFMKTQQSFDQPALKRQRSPTSEESETKHRRVSETEQAQQASKSAPPVPSWVNNFNPKLFEELIGVVDFVD